MTRTQPKSRKQNESKSFREDTRGVSTQIDLLFGVLIVTGAFMVFLIGGVSLITNTGSGNPDADISVQRAAAMLADDYLVSEVNNATLDRDCTKAFFDQSPDPTCNQDPSWSVDTYLEDALPVGAGEVNVTIQAKSGGVISVDGVDLSHGDPVPDAKGDVSQWSRYVALDANGDGSTTIYRLYVNYW
jgi:hypothetical protein